jgi:heterodisulfide reductase subunit A-like polyferredoxin
MVKLSVPEIREIIKPCGLSPQKSKAIHELSKLLLERHGGAVPRSFEELEALPGVGHKTASVVMAHAFGVPRSPEGFFLEAHSKVRPMDFADDGLFLAGMAHYPKFIEECITHAKACAARTLTILTRPSLQLGGVVAVVDPAKCTGCLTCVRTCPFGIPAVRPEEVAVGGLTGAAWIDPARCQGCGTCTAECPARAIQLEGYRDEQLRVGLGAWLIPEVEAA